MLQDITIPDLGDQTDVEVQFSEWLVAVGDEIRVNDDIAELITDKAVFALPAPVGGQLAEQSVHPGETVRPGTVIGRILVAAGETAANG